MLRNRFRSTLLLLLMSAQSFAEPNGQPNLPADQTLYDLYPNAVAYYYGITGRDALMRMLLNLEFHRWQEHVQSIEYARTLPKNNFLRSWLSPIVGVVEIAMNVSVRNGRRQTTIYEFDPYLAFRWANLPWNHYINTSFAIGEGFSYATTVPTIEKMRNDDHKRFLNYLMLEMTLAPPKYPRLQLLARIHHRSGAYGLYNAGNTGSNVIGLGLRFLFD